MMESWQSTQHGIWNGTTSKNLKFFGQPALQLVECGKADNQRIGWRGGKGIRCRERHQRERGACAQNAKASIERVHGLVPRFLFEKQCFSVQNQKNIPVEKILRQLLTF